MALDMNMINELAGITEEIMRKDGLLQETGITTDVGFTPMVRMTDRKSLYPWQGKESDGEIAFAFESVADAQHLYDFVTNTGLLKPGEVKIDITEHQASVHFASHVLFIKPEVVQATMAAYYNYVEDDEDNGEAFEALAEDVAMLLQEKIQRYKVSGVSKAGRRRGNKFHDKSGNLGSARKAKAQDGGSWSDGKTKVKYTGSKKAKNGNIVVNYGSTKHPCGRAAREVGQNVRCWDGKRMEYVDFDENDVIDERIKTSGVPKGRAKGNPFHDKSDGKFTGPANSINAKDGGSWAIGKRKLKFTGSKRAKNGDLVISFGSTKHPCGRAARVQGKDVRCWDGKKGRAFESIATMLKKTIMNDRVDDTEVENFNMAVDAINEVAGEMMMSMSEAMVLLDEGNKAKLGIKGETGKPKKDKVKMSGRTLDRYTYPGGVVAYVIEQDGKTYRISPDERHEDRWRADRFDGAVWAAIDGNMYKTPEAALKGLLREHSVYMYAMRKAGGK